jgi:hypothetical protein
MAFRENLNVKLPEIKLPEFSGDLKSWSSFFEEFSAAVDDQDIPEKRKMQYLKSALKGEPLEIVEAYPLEAKNYQTVLKLLKKQFGDTQNIKNSLHSALRKLKKANNFMPEIKKTHREIRAILNQLENAGENIENAQLIFEVESKYPQNILRKIYERKKATPDLGTKGILEFLDDYLKLEEDIYRVHREFDFGNEKYEKKYGKFEKYDKYNGFKKGQWKGPNKYENKTIANMQKRNCKFCGDEHWEDKCPKYKTNDERLAKAKELKICLKCLGKGHISKECKKNVKCFTCKKDGHNSAFCRQKAKKVADEKKNYKEYNKIKNEKMCMATEINEENDNKSLDKVLMNNLIGKKKKEKDITLMQVALAPVRNPYQGCLELLETRNSKPETRGFWRLETRLEEFSIDSIRNSKFLALFI